MPVPESRFYPISAAVTRELSQSVRAPEALHSVLQLLHTELRSDFSALWRVDYEQLVLRCVVAVTDEERFPQFKTVTLARRFALGVGMPGTVWQNREPVWMAELQGQMNFPRASVAAMEDLNCAVGFPICHASRVLGVYEFFFRERRTFRPQVEEFLMSVGRQIGLYLERLRVEYELTGSDESFHKLSDSYVDAIITIDERGAILYVNPALEQLSGYSVAELQGQNLTILMPADLAYRHEAAFERYLQTGQRRISWNGIELSLRRKDGIVLPVEIAFDENRRLGQRVFSGYIRPLNKSADGQ